MFDALPRPLLFAHRGASIHAPENTLAAFELASRTGADVLELDVHLTKDRRVVVLHDATVDRTTDGRGPVRELELAALKSFDAGARFRPEAGLPFRGKAVSVPLLEEVLAAFPRAAFNIEIKPTAPGAVPAVLEVLAKVQPDRLLLTAADDGVMRELEVSAGAVPLGMSYSQVRSVVRAAYLGGMPERFRGRALQIPARSWLFPVATSRVIRAARAAGMEVHVWTVNAPRAVLRALRRGADGVMSDDPGEMSGLFADFRAGRVR
jgi:glycerophosphoryl diester phosphodiesterase